jgi:class 3 adenylate cyclase/pimeloyl-ACP methyl ester carboxylesterase
VELPETRYARSGDVNIAYQVVGDGPSDLVFCPPFASNVELIWDNPQRRALNEGLASIARLIAFDKRGTGLSDRIAGVAPLEERMDDVRAVMDTASSERAVLLGIQDGGPLAVLFAATYPERCSGIVLWHAWPRYTWASDFPWGAARSDAEAEIHELERSWGSLERARGVADYLLPDDPDREALAEGIARIQRHSASPGGAAELLRTMLDIDVRPLLPTLTVPALVLSREGMAEDARHIARYLAEQIPLARHVEFPGSGNVIMGDSFPGILAEIEGFLDDARRLEGAGEPERVLASVLFTDIVDSTARAVEVGDRRWRELVAEHHARVRRELQRHRGREIDTAGDGFFARFDGPARAIRCACAVRDAVAELGLEVRAGVHTGECEQVDGKIAGVAVVTGARIASLASPGDVLVSATVRDLVAGSGLAFEDRGVHSLKGLPEQRRIYAVADAPLGNGPES